MGRLRARERDAAVCSVLVAIRRIPLRAALPAIAVAVGLAAAGCGGDDEPSGGATGGKATTTQPRPISAGYCLQGAGVKQARRVSDLSFAKNASVEKEDTATTGVGKATASFKAGGNYIYVVAKPGQEIEQSVVLASPTTYEFVGFLDSPDKRVIAKAGDCLDGLVGDDD